MKNESNTFKPLAGFEFDYDNQAQIIAEINESLLMGELQLQIDRNMEALSMCGLTCRLYGHKSPKGFFRVVHV
jgi:hypothetical protein